MPENKVHIVIPICVQCLVLCLAALISRVSYPQDMSTYYSVQHANEFELDFANELYRTGNLLTEKTRAALHHFLDLNYGEDAKQRLDIYLPKENVSRKAPVLLFLHGGGFSEGDRAHYGFIASPYAEHGILTVIASYRLSTSGFSYPAPVDDAKAAVTWIYRNIAKYGGDPEAIFVSGHSAGAILVADIGGDRSWLRSEGIPTSAIRGMAPISGNYLLSAGQMDNYAPTVELKEKASPILHINDPAPAAVIAFGEHSGDAIEEDKVQPSRDYFEKLKTRGVNATLVALEGQNHIQVVFSFADPQSPLFVAMIGMIRDIR